jgi:FkbM family methyltransferase
MRLFIYEDSIARFLARISGTVFIDAGANIGFYTSLLNKNFITTFSVEPHPQDARILRTKLPNCHNVIVVEKAMSDTKGTAFFSFKTQSLEWFRNEKRIMVETDTLNNLLHDYDIDKVDLIKVDVEGAEWKVLKGAESLIKRIFSWMVELHNWDYTKKIELEEWFRTRLYQTKWLDKNHLFCWRR